MITLTFTNEYAEALLTILGDSEFPLISLEHEVAEETYDTVADALEDADNDEDDCPICMQ